MGLAVYAGLRSGELLEWLEDREPDNTAFHENCRAWARRVLVPRALPGHAGD